jgi:hypothetical protein
MIRRRRRRRRCHHHHHHHHHCHHHRNYLRNSSQNHGLKLETAYLPVSLHFHFHSRRLLPHFEINDIGPNLEELWDHHF